MSSISEITKALDSTASQLGYSCKSVSWEDAQRGTVSGSLSCWGSNISDVRLWEKSGKLLYTLRSQNWNEKLGYVSSKDVAVVVGNQTASSEKDLQPVNLRSFLENIGHHGSYAGLKSDLNLSQTDVDDSRANGADKPINVGLDDILSVRFQTVFLPVEEGGKTEFCTEVYNYNTHSDENPRNLLLLCAHKAHLFNKTALVLKKCTSIQLTQLE